MLDRRSPSIPTRSGRALLTPLALTIGFALACVKSEERLTQTNRLTEYLPQDRVEAWRPHGSPQFLEGDDLYTLLNDRAGIFREYGAVSASFRTYRDGSSSIRLELFDMQDPAGAYGIFTFHRNEDCRSVDIGREACLRGAELAAWKERFFIRARGSDERPSTLDGLQSLVRTTCDPLPGGSGRPEMVAFLPLERVDETSIRYMKGDLALRSAYDFGTVSPFHVNEGLLARLDASTVFIFEYPSEKDAKRALLIGISKLTGPHLYQQLVLGDIGFRSPPVSNPQYVLASQGAYVLVVAGENLSFLSSVLELLRRRVPVESRGKLDAHRERSLP